MSTFNLTWPVGVQQQMQTALDSYMDNIGGRVCTLWFPPTPQPLAVGQSENPIGDLPNSYWTDGNPQWSHTMQPSAPYQGGNNFRMVESTGTCIMVVYDKPSTYNKIFPIGERHPEGTIMTRGFVSDLQNVLNATRMSTYLSIPTTHYNFTLQGEPRFPSKIIQNRYFYCLWYRC